MADDPTIKKTIIINGKEITGPENVPEFLKQFVQDANKNGIPDMMENLLNNPLVKKAMARAGDQLQNLTPEQRAKIDQLMAKLGGIMPAESGTAATSVNISTVSTIGGERPASFGASASSSGAVTFNAASPQIDYKMLGMENPDRKSSFPMLLIAALLGGLIVLAAVFLFKGHL